MTEETKVEGTEVSEQSQETVTEEKKIHNSGSAFYKQKLTEMAQQNAQLQAQLEQIQTKSLQEKENFKELWELEKTKRTEAEAKAQQISESYFNGLKMSAIEQEALKAGIDNRALHDIGLLDNSMVAIETTSTGNANVLGAKEFVEQLKEMRPHWFKDSKVPIVNSANPSEAKVQQKSHAEIAALQTTDPAAYRAEMMKLIKRPNNV